MSLDRITSSRCPPSASLRRTEPLIHPQPEIRLTTAIIRRRRIARRHRIGISRVAVETGENQKIARKSSG
jgi:hypothetical protein